ncbi:MAG: TM2 domain-containing protein [Niastella sp.]|nr:TM2 domain-containing protein [Niastella sp.]
MYYNNAFNQIPGLEPEEFNYLVEFTKSMPSDKLPFFISMYSTKRKKPDAVLICALIGFLGINGVQRFLIGQMGMGILYFLTGGLCLVGTIIDIINHKQLAFEYNQKMAIETMTMVGGV